MRHLPLDFKDFQSNEVGKPSKLSNALQFIDLDNFGQICYFVDDESFGVEECLEAFDVHDAMLENANNGLFDLTIVTSNVTLCDATIHPPHAVEPFFSHFAI